MNDVWEQASITWNVVAIKEVNARNADQFERMMRGEIPVSSSVIGSVLPENISSDSWDLFIIHDLGGFVGGIYFPDFAAIVQPEVDPNRQAGFNGGLIRITAHEFGHSLSLPHVSCIPPGNLMAPGCRVGDRTFLNERQIEETRAQAFTGVPYDGSKN